MFLFAFQKNNSCHCYFCHNCVNYYTGRVEWRTARSARTRGKLFCWCTSFNPPEAQSWRAYCYIQSALVCTANQSFTFKQTSCCPGSHMDNAIGKLMNLHVLYRLTVWLQYDLHFFDIWFMSRTLHRHPQWWSCVDQEKVLDLRWVTSFYVCYQ